MSKLDSNERWKSKMLLTEHQEQYDSRQNRPTRGRATTEEVTLIRDYILLPRMITVLEKSMGDLERSTIALKDLNIRFIQVMIDRVADDLHRLRRDLRSRNIRVYEDEIQDEIIYHRFLCRGHEERFGIVREVLRSEMRVRMTKYAADIVKSAETRTAPQMPGG